MLLVMLISTLNLIEGPLIPSARAVYVEGSITQDTVWTLVDSPFVVSNNIIINPNVTLTIEPGVEVRFGGGFSITASGKIIADGTVDRMIVFTTNDPTHNSTWESIALNGQQTSSFTNCIVEYGRNGLVLENGSLNIGYSVVRLNSENGIMIENGTANIGSSEISNNTIAGLQIAGGEQIVAENNIIHSNGDGILLSNLTTSTVNIDRNNISLNQEGIHLENGLYDSTNISFNNLFENHDGFLISTNTSTSITHNRVLNNTVGMLYANGTSHEAHFNNIYSTDSEDLGMDASADAFVNATYNYWGHRSGPFHESLNPSGKGSQVGGNGVNLDFIFFLSQPFDHNNQLPIATLWTDKILVTPNQNVTLIGTDSFDNDGRVDQYFFDFGDGTNSSWTTLSILNHTYTSAENRTYIASLKVIDDFNKTSENIATSTIVVRDDVNPLLSARVTLSNQTVDFNGNVSTTVYVSNEYGSVENANVNLFSVKNASFALQSGATDSTGHFTAIFTAPNVTEITNVRIVARASVNGYADGSSYEYLTVLPPLMVNVTTEAATVKSEDITTVTVIVEDSFDEPVSNVLLELSCDVGNLSLTTAITDLNGIATLTFKAPQMFAPIDASIIVAARKGGYAKGQGQAAIHLEPKRLSLELISDPNVIISGTSATLTAHVASDGIPIDNATVSVMSSVGGNFTVSGVATSSDGTATFIFNAPQTEARENTTGSISATVTKNGYVSGENLTTITIIPKILVIAASIGPNTTISESTVNVTAHVAYLHDMTSISEANVTLSYMDGVVLISGLTDANGNVTLTFTILPVSETRNVSFTARASKSGYVYGEDILIVAISPGEIGVTITINPIVVASNRTIAIDVYAAAGSRPLTNATVAASATHGNLDPTGVTDSSGHCTLIYKAPVASALLPVTINANVTKFGYMSAENQTTISITPPASSGANNWSMIILLLIIIVPTVIVAAIVVLVKKKLVVISIGAEEQQQ